MQHFLGKKLMLGLLATCLMTTSVPLYSSASIQKIDSQVSTTVKSFKAKVNGSNELLSKAKGLLVFPRVYQAGFGVGAQYGEGALMVEGKTVAHYRLTAGSFGFQMGGQRKSMILAFMTDGALQNFRSGAGWDIGADAAATILVLGAEGSITAAKLNKPVVAFVMDQKGLMYNLTLQGTKITKIKE